MTRRRSVKHLLALPALTTIFFVGGPAKAQNNPNPAQQMQGDSAYQNSDIARHDVELFDQFLNDHPQIFDELRKDPTLIDDRGYVDKRPELDRFLHDHPGVRQEVDRDPNAFMRDAERMDRRDDMRDREFAAFDEFLDQHREINEQVQRDPNLLRDHKFVQDHPQLNTFLRDHSEIRDQIDRDPMAFVHEADAFQRDQRGVDHRGFDEFNRFLANHPEVNQALEKDPDLIRDRQFVDSHPELRDFLRDHPDVRDQLEQNPLAYMHGEEGLDRRDGDRRDVDEFNRFLGDHREINEALMKDPNLVNDRRFVDDHPALKNFLQDHPQIREQIDQNPTAFMQQEERLDQRDDRGRDDNRRWDNGDEHDHAARFGQFLGSHPDVGQQLANDPMLCRNDEFLVNHPELKDYLNNNPDVQKDLMADPQNFVRTAQQFNSDKNNMNGAKGVKPPASMNTPEPKPQL
jgi:hypothetical protein